MRTKPNGISLTQNGTLIVIRCVPCEKDSGVRAYDMCTLSVTHRLNECLQRFLNHFMKLIVRRPRDSLVISNQIAASITQSCILLQFPRIKASIMSTCSYGWEKPLLAVVFDTARSMTMSPASSGSTEGIRSVATQQAIST